MGCTITPHSKLTSLGSDNLTLKYFTIYGNIFTLPHRALRHNWHSLLLKKKKNSFWTRKITFVWKYAEKWFQLTTQTIKLYALIKIKQNPIFITWGHDLDYNIHLAMYRNSKHNTVYTNRLGLDKPQTAQDKFNLAFIYT